MLSPLSFLILIFYFLQSPLGNNELCTPSTSSRKMVQSASMLKVFDNENGRFSSIKMCAYFPSLIVQCFWQQLKKNVLYDDGQCECLI